MPIVNLSAEPRGKLHSWIPHDFEAEHIVFLPDACPGKSPLPTGTAALTRQRDWRRFAKSDCGCGMRFLRSTRAREALTQERWNAVADRLHSNKGRLGDLGGGNHFLDALEPYGDGPLHFLVHTGSRAESGLVDNLVDMPESFDREFARIVRWAADNRAKVQEELEVVFGRMELLMDLPHNTVEPLPSEGAIIRKGAVRVEPGQFTIIPSHMSGDAVLVRATSRVTEILHSMSHGTGRTMPTGEAKGPADTFDFEDLRRKILIPHGVANASLRSDGPYAYRDLDACLTLLDGFVEEIERFAVIAYMGHL